MQKIRAAVCHAYDTPLVIEEVALDAPGPGEVEVTLGAVAICHSDISLAEGAWPGTLPAVFGHEAAGTITAVGAGVRDLAPGARVVVTLIRACGHCVPCATGHPSICATPPETETHPLKTASGGPLLQGLACGAFAEKVVVSASQVVAVPQEIGMDVASLIGCGVITGVGAVVNTARLRVGEDVVVIGAGGVGLNAIQGARIAGARRIVAVDRVAEKLEDAKAFGATDVVLAETGRPWRTALKALGRPADVVLVTVGVAPAYSDALRYVGRGGRVIMVGMPHSGAMAEYEPATQAYLQQELIGSKMGDVVIRRDIPWIVDLYLQGRLELDALVSRRWSLEEINEAIADTKAGKARRNVILF